MADLELPHAEAVAQGPAELVDHVERGPLERFVDEQDLPVHKALLG